MNSYVEKFIEKLADEAPEQIILDLKGFEIALDRLHVIHHSEGYLPISDVEDGLEIGISLNYFATQGASLRLQIEHRFMNNTRYDRLELHIPYNRYQLTCLHFGTVGLTNGEEIVEFSQKITFVNRDGKNEIRKAIAKEQLDRYGLLAPSHGKAPRWTVGQFNTKENKWIGGQTTSGFLRDFIKAGIIIGGLRGHYQDLTSILKIIGADVPEDLIRR
jgi:hypothetical protein